MGQAPDVIERMRVAGRIAANALAEAGKAVAPGVTTDQLDRIAHEYMVDHGAYPRRWATRASQVLLHVAQRGHLPRHP